MQFSLSLATFSKPRNESVLEVRLKEKGRDFKEEVRLRNDDERYCTYLSAVQRGGV